ncbi:pyruvoyl-dependent arginine decarboxylase (PvlArgDC) [Bosea sp. BE125]|uniref:hypothetical protein n=1 Tax=Bosea sp. BE125 TaxID=2817909 RepID=UPI00285F0E5D|nr:hypothetical protein [Bosea sp. BE125]MDR6872972.1 pyruvoyl-dependent arginine decarboxylase (PvlArgDC) [Bosea sp. BE125]
MATKSLEKHPGATKAQSRGDEAGVSAWLSAHAMTARNELHGLATLSQAQCETADYVAELAQSLASMTRKNGLRSLADVLTIVAHEAGVMARTGFAIVDEVREEPPRAQMV